MFALYKTNTVLEVDAPIQAIVDGINKCPLVATTSSCAGHYSVCRKPRFHRSMDAESKDELETVDQTVYCSSSMPPYLQWTASDFGCPTIRNLIDLSRQRLPVVRELQDEVVWAFAYDVESAHCNLLEPDFAQFWGQVVSVWNRAVDSQFALDQRVIPSEFPTSSIFPCWQCGR